MTFLINLRLHVGFTGGIFVTGIFTVSGEGEFLTSRTGIPGGPDLEECHE